MQLSVLRIIAGLLLLLIPAGVLYILDRKTLQSFVLATVRMGSQLLILCLIIWGMVYVNNPWLNVGWLVLVSLCSTVVALMRIKVKISNYLLPVWFSQFIITFLVGMYLLYVVFPVQNGMDARWFVPIMALLLGHTTSTQIRGLNAYFSSLKADEQQYEFLRGNGMNHLKAVFPFMRRAVLAIMSPTIANLSTLGLFTMPLLLCGILLGGFSPIDAFVMMLELTVSCVALSVAVLLVSIWLADKRLFDSFGKLMTLFLLLSIFSCGNKEGNAAQVKDTEVVNTLYDASEANRKGTNNQKFVMYELPAPLSDRPEIILRRKAYTTSYNQKSKTPNWVAWHLTKSHTNGSFQRKAEMFSEDMDVRVPRATNNDYYNSRYDRGHMCPAGDNKWDKTAMMQSFLFTNICPQNHGLNKYEWNDLEILCRDWARKYGAIDIVCGPLYSEKDSQKTIGKNKIWVPEAFYKVVLCRQGSSKAIGFVYRNVGKKQKMDEAVRTVDEIERLTGIDFFHALDDSTENRIEAKASLADW